MATTTAPRRGKPRLFLSSGWWMAALLALSFVAFWKIYVVKLPWEAERYVNLHAAGVVVWMLMLVAQPMLIRAGKRPLHRAMGKTTYALVPYIVVTAVLLTHARLNILRPEQFAELGRSYYLPFAAIVLFALCYALAIRHRRDMFLHGRFMVASALTLIDPIVARMLAFYTSLPPDENVYPAIGYGLTDGVLLLLLWFDRNEPRGRRAWLTILPWFLLVHIGWFTFARTEPWLGFTRWFMALPLT